jgi:hypothetical protein
MKKYILLTIAVLTVLSCSNDKNLGSSEIIGKTFDHRFVETEQECLASQTNPIFFINCHEEIRFINTETAEIMITDTVQIVNYTIKGNTITIIFPGSSSSTMIFEKISNSSLKLQGANTIWNKRIGNSVWNKTENSKSFCFL